MPLDHRSLISFMAIVLMTPTYKISSGRVTNTEVADFSLSDKYDIFERSHYNIILRCSPSKQKKVLLMFFITLAKSS